MKLIEEEVLIYPTMVNDSDISEEDDDGLDFFKKLAED
jgi:hypothetical protein